MSKTYTSLIFFLIVPVILYPQEEDTQFERISVEQGLSQSSVHCIFQDSKGFMWFGTEDGLNKYDGYQFTVYNNNPDDIGSLSSNEVWAIYEDSSEVLWIGTIGGGINKFDRNTEQFTPYKHDPDNPNSISDNRVMSVYKDHSGVLWIGTENGLNKYNREAGIFTHYLQNTSVSSICEDKSGTLLIGTIGDGLFKCDRSMQEFINYKYDINEHNSLSDNQVWSLYKDKSDFLWIGTFNGLDKLNLSTDQIFHYLPNNYIVSIYKDRSGTLWFGSRGGGLKKLDPRSDKFTHFRYESGYPNSISNNQVISIIEDAAGVLWIGTFGGGINKLNRQKKKFAHFRSESNRINQMIHNSVWSLYESTYCGKVFLWIGTDEGLDKLDRGKGFYTHYLSGEHIRIIYEDNAGSLWIGTYGSGLFKYDQSTDQFFHFFHQPDKSISLSNNLVWAIHESWYNGKYELWIGTEYGLNRLDNESGNFTRYLSESDNPNSLSYNYILSIHEDKDGILWLGTWGGGLNKFDRTTGRFMHYIHDADNLYSLSDNVVSAIYESHNDDEDILWIGTFGGGLNKFNRKTGQFICYREKDGLANDVIYGILGDNHGKLWISTNIGLSQFDPENNSFRNYDVDDGLQSNEFNFGACHRSKNGEMFFGGINGFTAFYPDSIKDNPHMPNVVITDFHVFNRRVEIRAENLKGGNEQFYIPKHISVTQDLEMSYKQNVFSFEFAALDYCNPQKNQYAYKMEGVDPDWVYRNASRRYVTYTQLDPGEYLFKVKGSNNDGIWNEKGTSLKIIITPPWWKTNWAYVAYIFLFGLTLYALRTYDQKRQHLKHELEIEQHHAERLEEVDRMKSRFFTNISHEFRTPLTLILGPLEQLISGKFKGNLIEQFKNMHNNGKRLLTLINQLLDLSKLESGKLKLQVQQEDIIQILRGIVQTFESMALLKKIVLKFNSILDTLYMYVDQDKLDKIIGNLLSNAFKFTPEEGNIEVSLKMSNAKIPMPNEIQNSPVGESAFRRDPKFPILSSKFRIPSSQSRRKEDEPPGAFPIPNPSSIEIAVSNTGPEIPQDKLSKIFDRFYQLDDSVTRRQEGTGIGLALTKELVELHHGTITVKSDIDNRSIKSLKPSTESPAYPEKDLYRTTFTVMLPVGKEHFTTDELVEESSLSILDSGQSEAEILNYQEARIQDLESKIEYSRQKTSPSDRYAGHAGRRIRPLPEMKSSKISQASSILIVEDNPDVTTYLRGFLEDDYQIVTALNGRIGIKKALDKTPDLIISDVMMPEMDGFELCKKLKSDQRTSHIPIILLTAKADLDSKIEGLEYGADDYIAKPFDAAELQVRSKNLIEQRRQLREQFKKQLLFKPADITVTSIDEQFLDKVNSHIEWHMDDMEYTVEKLADEIGMSRQHLNRKLQSLTNYSARDFIRVIRLKRAAQLLQKRNDMITQIAYQVGFNNLSYFSKCFRRQFGQSPSQYCPRHFHTHS